MLERFVGSSSAAAMPLAVPGSVELGHSDLMDSYVIVIRMFVTPFDPLQQIMHAFRTCHFRKFTICYKQCPLHFC